MLCFVNTMLKRNQIFEEQSKQLWPMAVQPGGAHGRPKACKTYANLPSFWPIIDTTRTPYFNIGNFLSSLLQLLQFNDNNLKDSFDAAIRFDQYRPSYLMKINSLFHLMSNRYLPMSESKRRSTSDRFYNKKLLTSNLKKRTIRKFPLDSRMKTAHLIMYCMNSVMVYRWGHPWDQY